MTFLPWEGLWHQSHNSFSFVYFSLTVVEHPENLGLQMCHCKLLFPALSSFIISTAATQYIMGFDCVMQPKVKWLLVRKRLFQCAWRFSKVSRNCSPVEQFNSLLPWLVPAVRQRFGQSNNAWSIYTQRWWFPCRSHQSGEKQSSEGERQLFKHNHCCNCKGTQPEVVAGSKRLFFV